MLFVQKTSSNPGTKLTGFINSLGEKNQLNNALWAHTNDEKLICAYITLTGTTATINNGQGVFSVSRIANGICRCVWQSRLDQIPCLIAIPLLDGIIATTSRRYATFTSGDYQAQCDVYLWDYADAAVNCSFFLAGFGSDAETTDVIDASPQSLLTSANLNRVVAMGNYSNPTLLDDTIWVISGCIGIALTNVSNVASITQNAAGNYSIAYTAAYKTPPLVFATKRGNTKGACFCSSSTTTASLRITDGDNATLVDSDFFFMAIGEMEVS